MTREERNVTVKINFGSHPQPECLVFFWRKTAKIKSDVSLVRAYFWYRALASSAKGLLISDNSLAVLVPHFGVEGVMIAIRPQVAAKMTVTQIMTTLS